MNNGNLSPAVMTAQVDGEFYIPVGLDRNSNGAMFDVSDDHGLRLCTPPAAPQKTAIKSVDPKSGYIYHVGPICVHIIHILVGRNQCNCII